MATRSFCQTVISLINCIERCIVRNFFINGIESPGYTCGAT